MKSTIKLYILSVLAIITACDIYPQDDFEAQVVVESYLIAQRTLPQVRISTTLPVDEVYSFDNAALSNAVVEVRLLTGTEGSPVEQSFSYTLDSPGIYTTNDPHEVMPLRSYELFVRFNDNSNTVRSFTTVPDTFRVVSGVPESIVYQSTDQLEIEVTRSDFPGRQNVFVFSTISLDPDTANITPVYADLFDDDDFEDLTNNSSGIINEGNFEVNPSGTITIDYPWLAVAFFGENDIIASTIDDNLLDFIRSQEVQLGGSTLSPGEIQNVIFNVEGGIGVFGAIAADTVRTDILRPDGF